MSESIVSRLKPHPFVPDTREKQGHLCAHVNADGDPCRWAEKTAVHTAEVPALPGKAAQEILDALAPKIVAAVPATPVAPSAVDIAAVCDELKAMLLEKNRKYGDSALNPLRVFSRADPVEQIRVRIDDKLSRIRTTGAAAADEDTEWDLLGYLALLRVAKKRAATGAGSGG